MQRTQVANELRSSAKEFQPRSAERNSLLRLGKELGRAKLPDERGAPSLATRKGFRRLAWILMLSVSITPYVFCAASRTKIIASARGRIARLATARKMHGSIPRGLASARIPAASRILTTALDVKLDPSSLASHTKLATGFSLPETLFSVAHTPAAILPARKRLHN